MIKKGIILTILTLIGSTFLIFNSIFGTFEFFIKYQIAALITLIFALIFSVLYAIVEILDGDN